MQSSAARARQARRGAGALPNESIIRSRADPEIACLAAALEFDGADPLRCNRNSCEDGRIRSRSLAVPSVGSGAFHFSAPQGSLARRKIIVVPPTSSLRRSGALEAIASCSPPRSRPRSSSFQAPESVWNAGAPSPSEPRNQQQHQAGPSESKLNASPTPWTGAWTDFHEKGQGSQREIVILWPVVTGAECFEGRTLPACVPLASIRTRRGATVGAVHEGVRPVRCCNLSGVLKAQVRPRSHPNGRYTSWERYVIRVV